MDKVHVTCFGAHARQLNESVVQEGDIVVLEKPTIAHKICTRSSFSSSSTGVSRFQFLLGSSASSQEMRIHLIKRQNEIPSTMPKNVTRQNGQNSSQNEPLPLSQDQLQNGSVERTRSEPRLKEQHQPLRLSQNRSPEKPSQNPTTPASKTQLQYGAKQPGESGNLPLTRSNLKNQNKTSSPAKPSQTGYTRLRDCDKVGSCNVWALITRVSRRPSKTANGYQGRESQRNIAKNFTQILPYSPRVKFVFC